MTDVTQGQQPEASGEAPSDGASSTQAETQAQQVADIMAFDPFGPAQPAEAGQSDDTGTQEGEGEAGAQEGQEDQPGQSPSQPEPQSPTQQGPTPREQELLAQVAALQQAIQKSQPQAQPKPQDAPGAKYNLGLPPQVIQGLRSEDEQEFAVAMHAVVNGIANKLWTDVQENLAKVVIPQFDQRIGAVLNHSTQSRQVHDDFYGAYPHLNNPAVMPLVQSAALEVAKSWHAQGRPISWGKDFADAVAAQVHTVIPVPQQQQVAPQPTKRPQFTARPGSRPAPAKGNEFGELL